VTAKLTLSGQWSGTFEGLLVVTNTGASAASQWSTSFISRYQLRNISDFSVSQSQLSDGTYQVTLKPPSWGLSLAAGASASSYVQGTIPAGTTVVATDLMMGQAPAPTPITPSIPSSVVAGAGGSSAGGTIDPIIAGGSSATTSGTGSGISSGTGAGALAPADPITNPMGTPLITVTSTTTQLQASDSLAETFKLSYAWGRKLTIDGFDSHHDVIDLRGFWGEAKGAHAMASPSGALIDLGFNAQQVLLTGVDANQLGSANLIF
jgi:hypothetical protein